MKVDFFQSCGHCWVMQIFWHILCSTFTVSSFRIWNSLAVIPSFPLALFIVYFLRPTWVHITGCLALGEWPYYWKVVDKLIKMLRCLTFRGEEFNPGPEMRLDHSELLRNKVLFKYKKGRESFWQETSEGGRKIAPLASVSYGVIYFLISCYNESK